MLLVLKKNDTLIGTGETTSSGFFVSEDSCFSNLRVEATSKMFYSLVFTVATLVAFSALVAAQERYPLGTFLNLGKDYRPMLKVTISSIT